MNGEFKHTKTGSTLQLSTDEIIDVIDAPTRRTVLFHLRQHGAATIDELVDVLIDVAEFDANPENRRKLTVSLVHVHLPKLDAAGILTIDDDGIVEAVDLRSGIGEWLDLAVRHDLQYDSKKLTPDESTHEGAESGQGTIRVLLVDDEPNLAEAIGAHFESEHEDLDVTPATSAPEAMTRLKDTSFDCVVSDYKMPGISGLDFLKALREEDPDIPFIVYTAKGSEDTASEAIASGVTDYVRKQPGTDDYEELAQSIRRVSTDE